MKKIIYSSLLILPSLTFAQTLGNLPSLVGTIKTFLNSLLPLLIAVAVIYFFWGLVMFIRAAGSDPKAAENGKTIMIWGIVALFVMLGIWGIVGWLLDATGFRGGTVPAIPTI